MKKTMPLRSEGSDQQLGASSLQVFQGEDPEEAERKKMQQEQQRQWLQQQRDQSQALKQIRDQEQRLFDLQELSKTQRVQQLSSSEEQQRIELTMSIAEFNRNLSEIKAETDKAKKLANMEANAKDLQNTFYGALLSENPAAAIPSSPGHGVKVLSDRYKGMSEDERKLYRVAQLEQVEEKRKTHESAAQDNAMWDSQAAVIGKAALLRQREAERSRIEQQRQQVAANFAIAAEQKARREHENKIAAKNEISNGFHDQFNRSSR